MYGAIYTWTNAIPKYLDFDTYNKLSISEITPTTSNVTLTRSGEEVGNTYYIGTASSIYIKDAGTYDAAITASDKFALSSNVVSGTVSANPLGNYRSATVNGYLDYGSDSDRAVTICFWAKIGVDATTDNGVRGFIRLGNNTSAESGTGCPFGTYSAYESGNNRIQGWTGDSGNAVYTYCHLYTSDAADE